jgi:hypothetical protein
VLAYLPSYLLPTPETYKQRFQESLFRTICCGAEIVIGIGVPFPDCPNHKNLPAEWKQIPDVDPAEYKPNVKGKINLFGNFRNKSA